MKPPWGYNLTAVIPHWQTVDLLKACLASLWRQTERPYVLVIDTGSYGECVARLLALPGDGLEIVRLQRGQWRHPCARIAAAIDVGLSLVQTERVYLTHTDCILKDPLWLSQLCRWTNAARPVVGYEMSPRDNITTEWRGMVGHMSTCLYMPTVHRLGLHWSMQHAVYQGGIDWNTIAGWPDTETCFGRLLRSHMVEPFLVGHESNNWRWHDERMFHLRAATTRLNDDHSTWPERSEYMARYHELVAGR